MNLVFTPEAWEDFEYWMDNWPLSNAVSIIVINKLVT